jgi:hypothetical protein
MTVPDYVRALAYLHHAAPQLFVETPFHVNVNHDDDCGIYRSADCDCDFSISVGGSVVLEYKRATDAVLVPRELALIHNAVCGREVAS